MEFRRKWAPLVIAAGYSVLLLVPALMPSVQARDALPPMGTLAFAAKADTMRAGDGAANDAAMAALNERASAALRDLQMASARPL